MTPKSAALAMAESSPKCTHAQLRHQAGPHQRQRLNDRCRIRRLHLGLLLNGLSKSRY